MSDLAKYKMTLALNCQPCDRWVQIILQDWLNAGKPDIYYVERKFKCEVCGGKADKMGFKKIVKLLKREHNRTAFKSQHSNFAAFV